MNFEQNKFGHPFNGGNQYFNQLSARIQQRAGIDVIKINDHVEPKIEFTKKQKQMPVQLTVEFGFPLTAEKIEKEEISSQDLVKSIDNIFETKSVQLDEKQDVIKSDLGEIHIEPLNVQPNATPYWHEFNADDELEGLILDSDGQEMSDITITGDGVFDLDQQIFHEISPMSNIETEIVDEAIQEVAPLKNNDVSNFDELDRLNASDISNEINDALIALGANDLNVSLKIDSENTEEPSVLTNEVISNIGSLPIVDQLEVTNDVNQFESSNADATNQVDSLSIISNEVSENKLTTPEIPSFSFSFIPEIEPAIEPIVSENSTVESVVESINLEEAMTISDITPISEPLIADSQNVEVISAQIVEVSTESTIIEETAPIEMSFSDADLDAIHEEFSAKEMSLNISKSNKTAAEIKEVETVVFERTQELGEAVAAELEFSDADLDMLHNQMANESTVAYVKSSAGSTVNIPVFEDATEETANPKLTWMDLIPWSSVFGVVASLMAIAAAWFIWNSIQKPMAIDEFIDKAVVTAPITPVVAENSTVVENLSPEEYIATAIIEDVTAGNTEETTFNFSELSERSRVSAVELEKLGLTSLNLEDPFFEEYIF